ncbi:cytochrome c biogenesis CcdA family protein [Pseudonocardia broussonetiae]|uniref:Cytochrome c biogenesis protein CcdA n=1 Tax=Pseudonocardia broussonetiae TaxID=2736640 RepID=A0A6M6JMI4_9PSEU|nr:cytochrome c biogenesis protein CcdA [Pseudonocardia broussonetiae]QJY47842.1 cytochrome c biogenesis protein CcdA [Pseudonocardia broussonetiae]
MSELLVGTTLLVSFLGGMVALLAPCCVSVMLPAYLATGFRHRGGVLVATLVFGAGVATVILPIGLGAAVLSRLFIEQHATIYLVGGAVMVLAGAAVLTGWMPRLPMPGGRGAAGGGFGSAYLLGAFSGIASACCAPVLIGIAVLSGASASFPAALGIGLAYVAGMVAPLAVAGLLWDKHSDRATRLLTARTVELRLGRLRRRMPLGVLLSGLLMIGMGVLAWVLAFAGPGMATDGWQVRVSAWLQHTATGTAQALDWVPGWVFAVVLVAGFAVALRRGLRTRATRRADLSDAGPHDLPAPVTPPIAVDTMNAKES